MLADELAQQPLAVPVAVGVGRVEKLQPSSTARLSDRSDSASSEPVQPAMPHMPQPISLIFQPVRPKVR